MTRTIRDIPTEIRLGEAEGLPVDCAASFDNLQLSRTSRSCRLLTDGDVGDSRAEVEQLVREAVAFHLEGLARAGEPIPKPSVVGTTRVRVPAA